MMPGVEFRDIADTSRTAVAAPPEGDDEPMQLIAAEQPPNALNPMLGGINMMFKDDDEWHYCLVTDPPQDLHQTSKIAQFTAMGYETVQKISDAQVWMRIAQSTHQSHLRAAEQAAADRWKRPPAAEKENQREIEEGRVTHVTHSRESHIVTHPNLA